MTGRAVVVTSAFGGVLGELAGWVGDELRRAGMDTTVVPAGAAAGRADLVLLVGAGPEFEPVVRDRRHAGRVVLWCLDPLPPPGLPSGVVRAGLLRSRPAGALRRLDRAVPVVGSPGSLAAPRRLARRVAVGLLGRSVLPDVHGADAAFAFARLAWLERAVRRDWVDELLVSSPAAVRTLAERSVDARFQPVAPHPAMGRDLGRARDLPVVFLGSALDARRPRLHAVGRALAARGVPLTVVDRACFAADRTTLLNRARVVLNLHKFPWHLERMRLLVATANGALFASELPVPDPDPFVAGRDLLAIAPDQLADAVADHLDGDERAAKVASAAAVYATLPDLGAVARSLLEAV